MSFFIMAALAGIGVALAAGPLGAFVVWRRMAYFGDATAHAAMLGVALALAFDISIVAGTLTIAIAMALSITYLAQGRQSTDAVLGVFAHAALALGLVAVSFVQGVQSDLSGYLFGDIFFVTGADLVVIWVGAGGALALLGWRWSRLLTATMGRELAHSEGIDPRREMLFQTLALAIVVAVAIKVVGALLIGAMLIIPASAARSFARNPEEMALVAALIGAVSVVAGLALAGAADLQGGPSIVTVAAAIYALSLLKRA